MSKHDSQGESDCRATKESIVAVLRDPVEAFARKVRCVNYSDCWYFQPMTVAQLDSVDPEVGAQHYNASYHNPAEFQFVLAGNFQASSCICVPCGAIPVLQAASTSGCGCSMTCRVLKPMHSIL